MTSFHQWNVKGRDTLLFGPRSYDQFTFPLISSFPFPSPCQTDDNLCDVKFVKPLTEGGRGTAWKESMSLKTM